MEFNLMAENINKYENLPDIEKYYFYKKKNFRKLNLNENYLRKILRVN